MSRRLLALAVVAAVAGCVAVTLIEGRPRDLPGVALGSPVTWARRALTERFRHGAYSEDICDTGLVHWTAHVVDQMR